MDEHKQFPVANRINSLSLRAKLIIGFTLISAFASFMTARGIYTNLQKQAVSQFSNHALGVAKLAALQQNGEEFKNILSSQDPLYEKFRVQNLKIRQSDPTIEYVFTMRKDSQGIYFVVDAGEPGEENIASYGERYSDATSTLMNNFNTMPDGIVEPKVYEDQYGSFLSAYAPIVTENGEQVGVIGVDILADTLETQQRQILEQSILVFLFALGLGAFFGAVAGNALTEPIVTLTKGASAFASGQLNQAIEVTTQDEIGTLASTFNNMASEIQELITGLEQRVADRTNDLESRTKELEAANENIQRRAAQFEALAQVAQSIASLRDLQELLPRVTSMISESYGFYHVGIFLLDDTNEYAVLTAANSAGGQKMLDRKHRLKVGTQGIVGSVAATGEPRIALDVGKDAVFFNNPDLPGTHSEMALPLKIGGKVIGALDVQSIETGAFSTEDVQTLSLLANQVSLAIENARLFDEANATLEELQTISRQATREAWKRLPQQQKLLGFRYNTMGASPLKEPVKLAEPAKSKAKAKDAEAGSFVVPIELRGEVIGNLVVQSSGRREWNSDEQDLIKAVADRVALSAENARLFEETSQRAERERLVSEITGKIRSHNDPQAMIETAVNELRNALGASRVEVVPQKTNSTTEKKD